MTFLEEEGWAEAHTTHASPAGKQDSVGGKGVNMTYHGRTWLEVVNVLVGDKICTGLAGA